MPQFEMTNLRCTNCQKLATVPIADESDSFVCSCGGQMLIPGSEGNNPDEKSGRKSKKKTGMSFGEFRESRIWVSSIEQLLQLMSNRQTDDASFAFDNWCGPQNLPGFVYDDPKHGKLAFWITFDSDRGEYECESWGRIHRGTNLEDVERKFYADICTELEIEPVFTFSGKVDDDIDLAEDSELRELGDELSSSRNSIPKHIQEAFKELDGLIFDSMCVGGKGGNTGNELHYKAIALEMGRLLLKAYREVPNL